MSFPPLNRIRSALIVGAYDGVTHDSNVQALLDAGVKCVLVEPVPAAFQRLREKVPGQVLINAAIYNFTGELTMITADPAARGHYDSGSWEMWSGSSSVKENARNNLGSELGRAGHLIEVTVPCYTFDDFAALMPELRFDYLQIDTEGNDWSILRQIDLARYGTIAMSVETMWLSEDERNAVRNHLRGWSLLRDDGCNLEAVLPQ